MARLIVILLISWAYVGCGARITHSVEPPELRRGRVRVAAEDDRIRRAIFAGAVSQPLVVVPDITPHEGCTRLHFEPPARYPDGTAVLPQDLIVDLMGRLRDPGSAARWLLSPVDGAAAFADGRADEVDGLIAEGANLAVCTEAPAPDLTRRLAHPDLQHRRRVDPAGLLEGPGAFRQAEAAALEPNPGYAGRSPLVERIELLGDRDAALLMEIDEADLALLYGAPAERISASPPPAVRLERSPAWDRRFVLWLNPQARWLNDPRFRRWVAGVIDRPAMLEYLFAKQGEPMWDLLDGPEGEAPFPAVEVRPVSPKSVPRFALSFAASDRHSARIAARIKATLRGSRVEVTLLPIPRDEFDRRLREGRVQAALVSTEPFFEDPLLRLLETCGRFGPSAADAVLVLDQAARLEDPESRLAAALAAQDILVRDGVVIPLLRVHAWLATRSGLTGIRFGPQRVLQFHEAGWHR